MLGNQEIDYGYYTNGWKKNELHQESCFEVAVTGLVCLLTKHQTACTQNADPEASLGQGCWS